MWNPRETALPHPKEGLSLGRPVTPPEAHQQVFNYSSENNPRYVTPLPRKLVLLTPAPQPAARLPREQRAPWRQDQRAPRNQGLRTPRGPALLTTRREMLFDQGRPDLHRPDLPRPDLMRQPTYKSPLDLLPRLPDVPWMGNVPRVHPLLPLTIVVDGESASKARTAARAAARARANEVMARPHGEPRRLFRCSGQVPLLSVAVQSNAGEARPAARARANEAMARPYGELRRVPQMQDLVNFRGAVQRNEDQRVPRLPSPQRGGGASAATPPVCCTT